MIKKAGIVACSDAVKKEHKKYSDELVGFLRSIGITPLLSSCIYKKNGRRITDSRTFIASKLPLSRQRKLLSRRPPCHL